MTSNIKTITIDDFYSPEEASKIVAITFNLQYVEHEFGKEIPNFNLVPPDADKLFSDTLHMNLTVDQESGTFRLPAGFIHFCEFTSHNQWLFAVGLQESTFNIFEHKSGIRNAKEGYQFGYRNLLEWDLTVNYILRPGQGIMFRPWLFHSFDCGLIQMFKLNEIM